MSYISRQRTREIGIRIALGADRSSLLRTVSSQGLTVSMAGIGIGLAGAAAASQVAASVLFGIRPLDGVTFGAVALILALVSLAAVMIPARRASRIEPMQALRHD
jgi:putative ABC transport system permease protein